jgi:hypothetical protein
MTRENGSRPSKTRAARMTGGKGGARGRPAIAINAARQLAQNGRGVDLPAELADAITDHLQRRGERDGRAAIPLFVLACRRYNSDRGKPQPRRAACPIVSAIR